MVKPKFLSSTPRLIPSIVGLLSLFSITAALLYWPEIVGLLAGVIMIIQLVMVSIISIRSYQQSHPSSKSNLLALIRGIGPEILIYILSSAIAILLAVGIGSTLIPVIADFAEISRPGWGLPAGILSGLLIALGVGLAVGFLMRRFGKRLLGQTS